MTVKGPGVFHADAHKIVQELDAHRSIHATRHAGEVALRRRACARDAPQPLRGRGARAALARRARRHHRALSALGRGAKGGGGVDERRGVARRPRFFTTPVDVQQPPLGGREPVRVKAGIQIVMAITHLV